MEEFAGPPGPDYERLRERVRKIFSSGEISETSHPGPSWARWLITCGAAIESARRVVRSLEFGRVLSAAPSAPSAGPTSAITKVKPLQPLPARPVPDHGPSRSGAAVQANLCRGLMTTAP